MGTVLMGTVLFLSETLTAGTFSSRGARTLSDGHVRPCVVTLHLIAKGRGHRVAGWYQNETLAAHCCSPVEAVDGVRTHHSSDSTWTVLTNGLNVLFPLPQAFGDRPTCRNSWRRNHVTSLQHVSGRHLALVNGIQGLRQELTLAHTS